MKILFFFEFFLIKYVNVIYGLKKNYFEFEIKVKVMRIYIIFV